MQRKQRTVTSCAMLLGAVLSYSSIAHAATAIDLTHASPNILGSFLSPDQSLEQKSQSVDFKKTIHVRLQQKYLGYTVWGGEAIVHVPAPNADLLTKSFNILNVSKKAGTSLDGTLYTDLQKDLESAPAFIFNKVQAAKAMDHVIGEYQRDSGVKTPVTDQKAQLIVFVDDASKAHWAFKVDLDVPAAQSGKMPAKPVYIVDAVTMQVYAKWDEIKTELENVPASGGGFGGNKKMGKMVYDGLKENLAKLSVVRDEIAQTCSLKNDDVTVKHYRTNVIPSYPCKEADEQHNKVYWNGELDAVNGGYSPDNDALFGGAVIKDMYEKWYGVPVLTENGKPMMLVMVVHDPIDNAFWDGRKMTFGDGVRMFYPLTSLGVAAHEISHGFTEQHSNLTYYGQSGGMNEAFSDMAAQAAEVYAYGSNSWQIGPEIFKAPNEALRYMDKPSKDCKGKPPGSWCSIDSADQYYAGLDVHFSSGVYNRFFYVLGTSEGWDAKKAFDVMVHANSNYWTSSTDFKKGACGVLKAAKDLNYDVQAIKAAFLKVAVATTQC